MLTVGTPSSRMLYILYPLWSDWLSSLVAVVRMRPNPPLQPTPLRVDKIGAILAPGSGQPPFRSIDRRS
jgi:hypothetical protein